MRGRTALRQLTEWMERPGNWRMKALLAAELPESPYSAEEVGEALTYLGESKRGRKVKEHHLGKRYGSPERLPVAGPDAPQRELFRAPGAYPDDFAEPDAVRALAGSDLGISKQELDAGVDMDRYMGRLLTSDSNTEKDVLWREQLLDTVIRGAEEAQVARDVSTVIEVNTQQGDHPVRGDDVFAQKIARGASIPFDEENWSTSAWKTDKYGLGAYVTEELLDQALIDVIEGEMRNLGRAAENSVNRVFMNALVDGSGAGGSGSDIETSPGETPDEVSLQDLLRLRNVSVAANFGPPDTLVMHDEVEMGLIANDDNNNFIFSNRAGEFDAKSDGQFPEGLIGLDSAAVVPDGPYNSSSNTWGFAANGEIGAVMYPQDLVFTYIRRDVESKDFDDPVRDLVGANVRVETDSVVSQSEATARLKH